jgi:hypothetical protein
MPIKTTALRPTRIRRARQRAGTLALIKAHRADVTAKLAEIQENLKLIDHKIDVYRGRLATGEADQLWAPNRQADAR